MIKPNVSRDNVFSTRDICNRLSFTLFAWRGVGTMASLHSR